MKTIYRKLTIALLFVTGSSITFFSWQIQSVNTNRSEGPPVVSRLDMRILPEENTHSNIVPAPSKDTNTTASQQPVLKYTDTPANEAQDIIEEKITLLQESYSAQARYDQHWTEEMPQSIEGSSWEDLSFNELLAKKQLFNLENQLTVEQYTLQENLENTNQLLAWLSSEKQPQIQLIDLQCGSTICKVVVKVPFLSSQYALLNHRSEHIQWVKKGFATVIILPDDTRVVTLYLKGNAT